MSESHGHDSLVKDRWPSTITPEAEREIRAATEAVEAHASALRARDKAVARHHLKGVTPRDLAALTGLSVGTIGHVYTRGREYLLADGEARWLHGQVVLSGPPEEPNGR